MPTLIHDFTLGVRFVSLQGPQAGEYAERFAQHTDVFWSRESLLATPFHVQNSMEKSQAVYWLAASAPPTVDKDYLEVFEALFEWPDPEFRLDIIGALATVGTKM